MILALDENKICVLNFIEGSIDLKIARSHFCLKRCFDSAINFVRCAAIDQLFSAFGFRIIHNHHSQDGHEVLYCPSYRRISICDAALLLCRFSSIVSIQLLRKKPDDGIVCILHGSTAPQPSNGKRASSRDWIPLAAMHSFPIIACLRNLSCPKS